MLTVREAAIRLGLQEATIRAWCAARRLAYVKLGRAVRIPEAEVERLVREGLVPARERRDGC